MPLEYNREYSLFGDLAHQCTKLSTHYTVDSHESAGVVAMARVWGDPHASGQPFFYRIKGDLTTEGVVVAGSAGWFLVHTNRREIEFKWSQNYAISERAMREPDMQWILRMMLLHSLPTRDVVRLLEEVTRDPDYSKPEWRRDGWRNAIVAGLKILEPEATI